MKAIKILGLVLLLVVVFVGVAIYITANNINQIVKQAVEEIGTETLNTKVTLAEADVRLTESRARLVGLTIQNPPGFDAPTLFEMNEIIVDLNLEAILDKRIDLTEVTVKGIQVVAEQKGTTTNIQKLLDQLPKTEKAPAPTPEETTGSTPPDIFVRIDEFLFADSAVTVITEKWGERKLSIPAIRLSDIGGDNGVPPGQLAAAIFRPLLKQINVAAKEAVKDAVEEKAKEKLEEKEDELKEKYRGKLKEKLGEDADEAESAIKSLLGK